ncbi:beta-galactosidase [Cohnella caldifontis]|uniref:beta-galactosidase n=1 Tax=Cohnella caldifontis TaxID=3027471 RepID=UPI0023EAB1A7|nr:beta-galactosidase [Cohnella sp. YIM B05605]
MTRSAETKSAVLFTRDAVRIGGESVILLSASLFYFRIPRQLWRERMEQVKALGYNCIDVYFPWNFHESREGEWDFGGDRDAEAFLHTAAEVGLWVIARPGPYICSEWDGGALPAYLLDKPGIRLRDRNPVFLRYVSEWFGRILPIVGRHEAGRGGSVICVQLDNELDFYGCEDPQGYIQALRDLALENGIAVPLIACAGQGGLMQASGLVQGVVPTCNFYPDNRDPDFEEKATHYREVLAGLNFPLLVTETNRSHFLLRRLLSCGAKLLGPYLQVSGVNFGFTNAVNNWGDPLAFLTSDYDFGGMVSPEGHLNEEAFEGRLLGRLIRTYGPALAEAVPDNGLEWSITGEGAEGIAGPFGLKLKGGGRLLFVSNVGEREAEIALRERTGIALSLNVRLAAGRSAALPIGVPLSHWDLPGTILHATAELYLEERNEGETVLAFHAEGPCEIALALETPAGAASSGVHAVLQGDRIRISSAGDRGGSCTLTLADGRKLTVLIGSRSEALRYGGAPPAPNLPARAEDGEADNGHAADPDSGPAIAWRLAALESAAPLASAAAVSSGLDRAEPLERLGVYRGYAWYEASVPPRGDRNVLGYLIRGAGDVVSLYADGRYAGTVVPGGSCAYLPAGGDGPMPFDALRLQARVEIWGHSNFDDPRMPGLRLNARKGIAGLAAVTAVRDITSNWRVLTANASSNGHGHLDEDALQPVVGFGGWLSPELPPLHAYRREFEASADADAWTVCFQDLQGYAKVRVNGREAGDAQPYAPYVDLTPFLSPGERAELEVRLQRWGSSGRVWVYEGVEARAYSVSAAEERELAESARSAARDGIVQALPAVLEPGDVAWLAGSVPNSAAGTGWRVRAIGRGLKLTALFAGRVVGRLWLPGGAARPVMTGGSADSFYLPGPWFEEGSGELLMLLEAVDAESPGRLESLEWMKA